MSTALHSNETARFQILGGECRRRDVVAAIGKTPATKASPRFPAALLESVGAKKETSSSMLLRVDPMVFPLSFLAEERCQSSGLSKSDNGSLRTRNDSDNRVACPSSAKKKPKNSTRPPSTPETTATDLSASPLSSAPTSPRAPTTAHTCAGIASMASTFVVAPPHALPVKGTPKFSMLLGESPQNPSVRDSAAIVKAGPFAATGLPASCPGNMDPVASRLLVIGHEVAGLTSIVATTETDKKPALTTVNGVKANGNQGGKDAFRKFSTLLGEGVPKKTAAAAAADAPLSTGSVARFADLKDHSVPPSCPAPLDASSGDEQQSASPAVSERAAEQPRGETKRNTSEPTSKKPASSSDDEAAIVPLFPPVTHRQARTLEGQVQEAHAATMQKHNTPRFSIWSSGSPGKISPVCTSAVKPGPIFPAAIAPATSVAVSVVPVDELRVALTAPPRMAPISVPGGPDVQDAKVAPVQMLPPMVATKKHAAGSDKREAMQPKAKSAAIDLQPRQTQRFAIWSPSSESSASNVDYSACYAGVPVPKRESPHWPAKVGLGKTPPLKIDELDSALGCLPSVFCRLVAVAEPSGRLSKAIDTSSEDACVDKIARSVNPTVDLKSADVPETIAVEAKEQVCDGRRTIEASVGSPEVASGSSAIENCSNGNPDLDAPSNVADVADNGVPLVDNKILAETKQNGSREIGAANVDEKGMSRAISASEAAEAASNRAVEVPSLGKPVPMSQNGTDSQVELQINPIAGPLFVEEEGTLSHTAEKCIDLLGAGRTIGVMDEGNADQEDVVEIVEDTDDFPAAGDYFVHEDQPLFSNPASGEEEAVILDDYDDDAYPEDTVLDTSMSMPSASLALSFDVWGGATSPAQEVELVSNGDTTNKKKTPLPLLPTRTEPRIVDPPPVKHTGPSWASVARTPAAVVTVATASVATAAVATTSSSKPSTDPGGDTADVLAKARNFLRREEERSKAKNGSQGLASSSKADSNRGSASIAAEATANAAPGEAKNVAANGSSSADADFKEKPVATNERKSTPSVGEKGPKEAVVVGGDSHSNTTKVTKKKSKARAKSSGTSESRGNVRFVAGTKDDGKQTSTSAGESLAEGSAHSESALSAGSSASGNSNESTKSRGSTGDPGKPKAARKHGKKSRGIQETKPGPDESHITVYGATSFVAKHVLRYLSQVSLYLPHDIRITLAGRDAAKLDKLKEEYSRKMENLATVNPDASARCVFDSFVADADAVNALKKMAKRTCVVLSCAGPFAQYGSNVVSACAKAGVDYVDITGEIQWAGEMRARYGREAARSGARIISFCGFDSVPSDMAVFAAFSALKDGANKKQKKSYGIENATTWHACFGLANGGTIHTALDIPVNWSNIFRSVPFMLEDPLVLAHPKYRSDSASEATRRMFAFAEWMNQLPMVETIFNFGISLPFFMAPVNAKVVQASAVALKYGKKFVYRERFLPMGYLGTTHFGLLSVIPALVTQLALAAAFVILKLPFVGKAIAKWLAPPGTGMSDEFCASGHAEVYAEVATSAGKTGRCTKVNSHLKFKGDPGNWITAQCVSECALCLLLDKKQLPARSEDGFGTPAELLGGVLLRRLQNSSVRPVEVVTEMRQDAPLRDWRKYASD